MDARKEQILRAVVDRHVDTAEPVGSLSIAREHRLGVSPATIRNDLQALEEAGYLEQPHASAGRIPSAKGYRYYVDHLMDPLACTEAERCLLAGHLALAGAEYDLLVQQAALLLAEATGYLAIVTGPVSGRAVARGLQLIGTAGDTAVYMGGLTHIFQEPEFRQVDRVRELLGIVEDGLMVSWVLRRDRGGRLFVEIGGEEGLEDVPHCSLVGGEYCCNGEPAGRLGVVGPRRMRYARAAAVVEELAGILTRILSEHQ